jgi:hypothetical protein
MLSIPDRHVGTVKTEYIDSIFFSAYKDWNRIGKIIGNGVYFYFF